MTGRWGCGLTSLSSPLRAVFPEAFLISFFPQWGLARGGQACGNSKEKEMHGMQAEACLSIAFSPPRVQVHSQGLVKSVLARLSSGLSVALKNSS